MADDSFSSSFGKGVVGLGLGFGLYYLLTHLGFGFKGSGTGRDGREPEVAPKAPPRAEDKKRLTFVMMTPSTKVDDPMTFRLRDDDPSLKVYALEEMLDRIKAGGRSDVTLRIKGSIIQGAADKAVESLKLAGISVSMEEPGPPVASSATPTTPKVSGNTRGQYGNA